MGNAALKPLVKWVGGKSWLLPMLARMLAPYRRNTFVDPFCGGLAIPLGLGVTRAIINDLNPHVINLYAWVQAGITETIPMRYNEDFYYRQRKRFNALVNTPGQETQRMALLYYYLTKTSYNGLTRFNRKGLFNAPFGRYTSVNYHADFAPYRHAFRRWDFYTGDFEEVPVPPQAVLFLDSPYDDAYTGYTGSGFDDDDQRRLARWAARHKGPTVVTNHATPAMLSLYRSHRFEITVVPAPRRISCTGDRTQVLEMIAVRNL